MWMNCEEVQQAVQLPQGTSEVSPLLSTPRNVSSQTENRPASTGTLPITSIQLPGTSCLQAI